MAPASENRASSKRASPDDDDHVSLTADALADRIEKDPAATLALRRLILEGIESGDAGEADDDWIESLMAGVRQRAAPQK